MSLTSPRFSSSRQLIAASTGTPIRQGASGRAVHLVQMALIDLGYPMPRSTTSQNYSPDGKFGNETRDKLIAFQNANRITPSGIIDRDTITKLDSLCQGYRHRVRLHFRSISLADVPFSRSLSDAEIVYGQYQIKIEFASGMSLGLTADEEAAFNQVDTDCGWVINDGEVNRLHSLGSPAPSTDILVYYVREFNDPTLLGCGGHATNRPACTVASNASRWDTAHEVCHVLLSSAFNPVHTQDTRTLMFPNSGVQPTTPVLTDRQVRQIRSSPCCRTI